VFWSKAVGTARLCFTHLDEELLLDELHEELLDDDDDELDEDEL
jgi:hypothetical protein